jgi:hypothetical protein
MTHTILSFCVNNCLPDEIQITLFLSYRIQQTKNSYKLSIRKYINFASDDLFYENDPRIM